MPKKTQAEIDQRFMRIVVEKARWSTCQKRHVAAIAVRNRRELSSGFNGAPSGVDDCYDRKGCIIINGHCALSVHAEKNVINNAAHEGVRLAGSTLYSLVEPCLGCTGSIINAGIIRVVWLEPYFAAGHGNKQERDLARQMVRQRGISWERLHTLEAA